MHYYETYDYLKKKTEQIKLKQLVRDLTELKYLGMKLNKIHEELQSDKKFYKQKQFIYPIATSGIIIVIMLAVLTHFLCKKFIKIKRSSILSRPLFYIIGRK